MNGLDIEEKMEKIVKNLHWHSYATVTSGDQTVQTVPLTTECGSVRVWSQFMFNHENPRMFLDLLPQQDVLLKEGDRLKVVIEVKTPDCGSVVVVEHHLMDLQHLKEWTNSEEYLNTDNLTQRNVFLGSNKQFNFSWLLNPPCHPDKWKLESIKHHLSVCEILRAFQSHTLRQKRGLVRAPNSLWNSVTA
mmetsp:Transcript_29855/g.58491  ORF Transcript_29855/g.58491 Transcript_29855/m.58491 type:complete len:190 (+) Transcript_29855:108-677(+)